MNNKPKSTVSPVSPNPIPTPDSRPQPTWDSIPWPIPTLNPVPNATPDRPQTQPPKKKGLFARLFGL